MRNYAEYLFELGERLAYALGGDKQAIADLEKLYKRHPEMFVDLKDLIQTIESVAKEPEIIINNPKAKSDKDFMVYKRLDSKKMGDIGIRNEKNKNIIFHANKKNIAKFSKIEKQQVLVEASSAKAAPTRLDHYASKSNDLPKCQEAHSTPTNKTIPQNQNQSQTKTKIRKH